ncbi:MAG TPA: acyltransferase [Chloroflexi bacterium]|jgi:glucan biosynthesis protein C|nr:acyltransferase [Chloroflexota bacterium]
MTQAEGIWPEGAARREHEIDWLRVLAMGGMFLFHCARFFDPVVWLAKNEQTDQTIFLFVLFTMQWMMPLLFVLSGFSTCRALMSHTGTTFARDRALRLMVPLLVGALVLGPPQVYIERLTRGEYTGTLGQFWMTDYFRGIYGMGGNFALTGIHLWYLFWLMAFTLVALPFLVLFLLRGKHIASILTDLVGLPGAILLPGMILFWAEAVSGRMGILWRETSWFLLTYFCLFLLGFLMATDARIRRAIQDHRRIALLLALITLTGVWLYWNQDGSTRTVRGLAVFLRSVNAWFWIVAILGYGRAHLRFSHPVLSYANEAVLPFYILHHPVIVVLGYAMRSWPIPLPAKFALLAVTSLVGTIGLYELVIRRIDVLRFLFGMRTRARQAAARRALTRARVST